MMPLPAVPETSPAKRDPVLVPTLIAPVVEPVTEIPLPPVPMTLAATTASVIDTVPLVLPAANTPLPAKPLTAPEIAMLVLPVPTADVLIAVVLPVTVPSVVTEIVPLPPLVVAFTPKPLVPDTFPVA